VLACGLGSALVATRWTVAGIAKASLCWKASPTTHSGGRSDEKTHDDVDGSVACAGRNGLAGGCTKRSCQHPCAQERQPNRQTGGVHRTYWWVRLCPGLD